jgi:hypothetical protein
MGDDAADVDRNILQIVQAGRALACKFGEAATPALMQRVP